MGESEGGGNMNKQNMSERMLCVYIYIYNYTVINWILKWTRQSSEKNVKMLKVAQDRKIITLKETEMESSPF